MKKRITHFLKLGIGFCFAISLLSVGVIFVAYGTAVPPEDIPPIADPVKPEPVDENGEEFTQPVFPIPHPILFHRLDGGA